jgi:hypothetical protein
VEAGLEGDSKLGQKLPLAGRRSNSTECHFPFVERGRQWARRSFVRAIPVLLGAPAMAQGEAGPNYAIALISSGSANKAAGKEGDGLVLREPTLQEAKCLFARVRYV